MHGYIAFSSVAARYRATARKTVVAGEPAYLYTGSSRRTRSIKMDTRHEYGRAVTLKCAATARCSCEQVQEQWRITPATSRIHKPVCRCMKSNGKTNTVRIPVITVFFSLLIIVRTQSRTRWILHHVTDCFAHANGTGDENTAIEGFSCELTL